MADRVANKDCRAYVQRCWEFKGSNLYAIQVGDRYVVYSYGQHWPLFINWNGQWYQNADKYSVTTSKHQSQSHPLVETKHLPSEIMEDFARYGYDRIAKNRLTGQYAEAF